MNIQICKILTKEEYSWLIKQTFLIINQFTLKIVHQMGEQYIVQIDAKWIYEKIYFSIIIITYRLLKFKDNVNLIAIAVCLNHHMEGPYAAESKRAKIARIENIN